MLDMREMRFSVVDLPPGCERQRRIIVEVADQDRVGLLVLGEHTLDLYTSASSDGGPNDWRHDERIEAQDGGLNWDFFKFLKSP